MRKKSDIVCKNCGKLFHPKRKESVFCCRECASEYNKVHGVFKKSDEQKAKLSAARKGKTPWNKGIPVSEEQKAKFRESIKRVWTEEKKEEQRQKQKEVWSDKELLEKHSKQAAERMKNNPEIKKKIAESVHEYNVTLTEEEWTRRYLKAQQTKKEHNVNEYISDGEKSIRDYVESLGFKVTKYISGKDNTRFEIDCYIEDKKIGIEYNGIYYHSVNGGNKRKIAYHFNKQRYAKELGIDLIQVWEDQWKNSNDLVKDIIAIRLGIIRSRKLYARQCIVKEIDASTYTDFCLDNHIQGNRPAKVKLGLYYKDELVQIASFGSARNYTSTSKDVYEWEWIRGACLKSTMIIGGTAKLFKYFIETYNPRNVMAYCDWNLFNGTSYERLGFEFIKYTGPDLFFVRNSSKLERIGRNPYANSEHKRLVAEGKLSECHGCGSKKYVWYSEE